MAANTPEDGGISHYEGEGEGTEIMSPPPTEEMFYPNRVFVNQIDSFHGAAISKFIASQEVGGMQMGAEDDQGEDENPFTLNLNMAKEFYEVIGTIKQEFEIPTHITDVINKDQEDYIQKILRCGIIVFDISMDKTEIEEGARILDEINKYTQEMKDANPEALTESKERRYFILISTIMTWGKTKPLDPDEPELPFVETDYRKRKPHINFKPHIELEKETVTVGRKHENLLKTAVIGTGITYGDREGVLDFLFRMAWKSAPDLPIFSPGNNNIPMIHIKDLASCVLMLVSEPPRKKQYYLAVEPSPCKLRQIVRVVAKELGNGRTVVIPAEHAFVMEGIKMPQEIFDMVTVNLYMEPTTFADVSFQDDMGFVGMGKRLVKEYCIARGLGPIRILIHGPPATGKTILAKMLAEHYDIPHLHIDKVIKEGIKELNDKIAYAEAEKVVKAAAFKDVGGGGDKSSAGSEKDEEEELMEEEEAGEKEGIKEWTDLLQEIEDSMKADENGRLADSYVEKLFMDRLLSSTCQNQGYVLDGWPKDLKTTRSMFGKGSQSDDAEEAEGEDDGDVTNLNTKTMPELVIALQASDVFLCQRIMQLPESDVEGTHYVEEEMLRRLSEFRIRNSDEDTMLNFFDEVEVHPQLMDVERTDMNMIFLKCKGRLGPPRNFGLGEFDLEQLRQQQQNERDKAAALEAQQKFQEERRLREERENNLQEWIALFERLRSEEEALLAAHGAPLRHYLAKYVLPTLTRGLLEVARIRPTDPIDYLAEYLFRENPEGKMLDPAWTQDGQELADNFMFVVTPPPP